MSYKDHKIQRGDCLPCMQDAVEALRKQLIVMTEARDCSVSREAYAMVRLTEAARDNERLRERLLQAETDYELARVARRAAEADNKRLRGEKLQLIATLQSIASNTCCDKCQEAALVARAALAGATDEVQK